MARLSRTWLSGAVLALLCASCPSKTKADSRTLVLHFEARGTDAALAERVNDAVRRMVDRAPSTELASLVVTASSLQSALRCTALDEGCLSTAALRTNVDRILFGEVATSETSNRHSVRLRLFDAFLGAIVEAPGLDESSSDPEVLASSAADMASTLLASPEHGAITVRGEPGSRVFVDGHLVDLVPARGSLAIFPVATGRHEVRIRRPDGRRCDFPVHVRARETARVGVELAAGDDAVPTENAAPSVDEAELGASRAVPHVSTSASSAAAPVALPGVPRDALAGPTAPDRPHGFQTSSLRNGIPVDGQFYLNGSVSGSGAKLVAKFCF